MIVSICSHCLRVTGKVTYSNILMGWLAKPYIGFASVKSPSLSLMALKVLKDRTSTLLPLSIGILLTSKLAMLVVIKMG